MMPSKFPIFKVSATGNDFLLVDLLDAEKKQLWLAEFHGRSRRELTRAWCDRHEGLGADGLVFLESDGTLDFAWDFYNSDGGSAEMCGNAARAVSLYVAKKSGKNKLKFRSQVGEVEASIHAPDDIEVTLPPIAEAQWKQKETGAPVFDFVRAGVPHAVVLASANAGYPELKIEALKVKALERFKKDGVNVTFVYPLNPGRIGSVTFERGVEDFTRACGTGAVAAAFSVVRGEEGKPVEVQVPGGRLSVVWNGGRPHLRGPAKIVAEMRVIEEA